MKEWFLGDIPLREFTIVWQSRAVLAERFAKRLFRRIKEEYGIALPLQDDTAPAARQEFSSVRPAGRIFFFNRMSML